MTYLVMAFLHQENKWSHVVTGTFGVVVVGVDNWTTTSPVQPVIQSQASWAIAINTALLGDMLGSVFYYHNARGYCIKQQTLNITNRFWSDRSRNAHVPFVPSCKNMYRAYSLAQHDKKITIKSGHLDIWISTCTLWATRFRPAAP